MPRYTVYERYCPEPSSTVSTSHWRTVCSSNTDVITTPGPLGPVLPNLPEPPILVGRPVPVHGPIYGPVPMPVPPPVVVIGRPVPNHHYYPDHHVEDALDVVDHVSHDTVHAADDAGHTLGRVAKTAVAAPVHFLRSAAERVTGDGSHPSGRHHLSDHLTEINPKDYKHTLC